MDVKDVHVELENEVTLYCNLGDSTCVTLVERFYQGKYLVRTIDSGEQDPTIEFRGEHFTGAKNILMHFFPEG